MDSHHYFHSLPHTQNENKVACTPSTSMSTGTVLAPFKEEGNQENAADSKSSWMPENGNSVQGMYVSFANTYEDFVQSNGVNMQTNHVMVNLMRKYWPRCPSGKGASAATIVDIGCGTGLIGKMFMQRAELDVFFASDESKAQTVLRGIDLTPEMLLRVPSSLYHEVLQQDAGTPWTMFKDNSSDISICNGVLIYLQNPDVLDEFVSACSCSAMMFLRPSW